MPSKLDEQLISIKEQIASALEAEKKILQRKKEEIKVREVYPDAEYAVLPDGSSGYITREIHLQTPGIQRRFFMDRERKINCFVGLFFKLGKGREVFVANPSSGHTSSKEVFDFANRWEAEQVKKRKINNEVEVVPERHDPGH